MVQADLDDIMSSIRTSVEAESAKPVEGSADLIEQAAAEAAVAEAATDADDDVLELTAADMTTAPAPEAVPAVAPAANVADVLGVPSTDDAADEFDKLLAEISAEKQTRAAEVAAVKEALLADIEPLGEVPAAQEPVAAEPAPTVEPEPTPAAPVAEVPAAAPAVALPSQEPSGPTTTHAMGMVEGADGSMQLTLPPEVLAMALRPMVQSWLNANLSGVVERLVREEIAKLNG